MQVVGLTGAASSGKDTVAGMFVKACPGWRRESFAKPLRDMLIAGGFVSLDELENRDLKELDMQPFGRSPRYLMQTLGTEWGRNLVHADVWLLLLQARVDALIAAKVPGVIITDVRFPNEAEYVRKMGRLVHIERVESRQISIVQRFRAKHASERPLPKQYGDMTLRNNGTLEDLERTVQELIAEADR